MGESVAALINNGVVENIIVIEPAGIPEHKKRVGCDHLIAVTYDVEIGDTYDEEQSIFLRDGVRVYPDKTDSERIAELETQIGEIQDALIEVADIITMSDSGEDGDGNG